MVNQRLEIRLQGPKCANYGTAIRCLCNTHAQPNIYDLQVGHILHKKTYKHWRPSHDVVDLKSHLARHRIDEVDLEPGPIWFPR